MRILVAFIAVVFWFFVFVFLFWVTGARAHEHTPTESPEQARIVEYYKTWKRPKGEFAIIHRQGSCCYGDGQMQDCFPVQAQRRNDKGEIEVLPDVTGAHPSAQIEFGGKWVTIKYGIEEDKQPDPRESPDGRSHVCMSHAGGAAVCFVQGYGG